MTPCLPEECFWTRGQCRWRQPLTSWMTTEPSHACLDRCKTPSKSAPFSLMWRPETARRQHHHHPSHSLHQQLHHQHHQHLQHHQLHQHQPRSCNQCALHRCWIDEFIENGTRKKGCYIGKYCNVTMLHCYTSYIVIWWLQCNITMLQTYVCFSLCFDIFRYSMFVDVRLQLGPRQSPMPLLAPLTSRVICKTCEKTVIKQVAKKCHHFFSLGEKCLNNCIVYTLWRVYKFRVTCIK